MTGANNGNVVKLMPNEDTPEAPTLEEFGDDGGGAVIDISGLLFSAYLAGLIDADGTIVWRVAPRPKKDGKPQSFSRTARISITMCDLDILEDVQQKAGIGHIYVEKKPGQGTKGHESRKTAYRWAVHKQDHILNLIACIQPYLGTRKGAKAMELYNLIQHWKGVKQSKQVEAKAK